ncbi:MAG: electron transport complex subunit RsxA [Deltaproteobacteria bacterium]|nr:MAG: electron transport complex subunit RsxA [Deltaproteobacteria bacterium]
MDYIILIINAMLINNILLAQYLGNCPFLGVSKQMDTALGMGGAVIFVITLASTITWCINQFFLIPFKLEYLRTLVFILVIASLVQFIEIFMKKNLETLYRALGIFLPLITTNCAVLGVALLCVKNEYTFNQMLVFSIASAVGYSFALVLFAGIRERYRIAKIPKSLQDTAIGLVTAGFMSLAFLGFKGMVH